MLTLLAQATDTTGLGYNFATTSTIDSGSASVFFGTYLVFVLLFAIVGIVAMWKLFTKAGQPGWASIVPIYNLVVLCQIAGKPGWWVLLFMIPLVNLVVSLLVALGLAKAFGRSQAFGIIGLWLFSFVGYLILAFGKSTFQSSSTDSETQPSPLNKPAESQSPTEVEPALPQTTTTS